MIKLLHGDCIELMKTIPDKSIDTVLCDLPYGTTQNKWDVIIPFEPLWVEYKRICSGAIVLTASQPFTSMLVCSNVKDFKYEIIWEKNKFSNFLDANKKPMKIHENILVFGNPKFNPVYWYSIPYKRWNTQDAVDKQTNYGKHKENIAESKDGKRQPLSIITFNRHERPAHPTQKPVALLEYLIKTYTLENETILDNCMGSGSTGVACVNTNRNFIGIEKDDKYFEIAKNRIEQAQQDVAQKV
jgi:site-specific DNA-methyltransferase (adenine-specific)